MKIGMPSIERLRVETMTPPELREYIADHASSEGDEDSMYSTSVPYARQRLAGHEAKAS